MQPIPPPPEYHDVSENFAASFPNDGLSPYKDLPSSSLEYAQTQELTWRPPPDPVWPTYNLSRSDINTCFPNYSKNADSLFSLINEQASYSPGYYVQIHGKHNETEQTGKKKSEREVTDFYFRINISHLFGPRGSGELQTIPDNKRGYRGTRYPSLRPSLNELERRDDLYVWCEKYVANQSKIKSFSFSREIQNHDTQKLYRLIRSAILETRYRGQLYITFPATHCKLTVYSPGLINKWRTTVWVRWFFYLTCLWIFSWPILILVTSRYDVVKSVFYCDISVDKNDDNRNSKLNSETKWFLSWERAIKRAVMAGVNTGDGILSDDYRVESDRIFRETEAFRTGISFSDELNGSQATRWNQDNRNPNFPDWGYDC